MKKLNFTLLLVFFTKTLVFGQIGKGVCTFKPDFSTSSRTYILQYRETSFTPSFGAFLSSRLLLEGQFSVSSSKFPISYSENSFLGHIKAQYYYLDAKRWKPYFSVGLGLGQNSLNIISNIGGGNQNFSGTYNVSNSQIATGTHYFLNKNVAIDGNLSYGVVVSNEKNVTKQNKIRTVSVGLTIDLKPFLDIASIKESRETTDFLHEGKMMLSGSISASTFKNSKATQNYKTVDVDANVDYFLGKRLAVGANVFYSSFLGIRNYRAGLSASYFFHLKKRFYFTPSIKSNIYFNDGASTFTRLRFVHTPNLSLYYFLNQNIALNIGLSYQFESGSKLTTTNYDKLSLDMGLKYFIN